MDHTITSDEHSLSAILKVQEERRSKDTDLFLFPYQVDRTQLQRWIRRQCSPSSESVEALNELDKCIHRYFTAYHSPHVIGGLQGHHQESTIVETQQRGHELRNVFNTVHQELESIFHQSQDTQFRRRFVLVRHAIVNF